MLLNLILVLLIGGALVWLAERIGSHLPRLLALIIVLADLGYLLNSIKAIPIDKFSLRHLLLQMVQRRIRHLRWLNANLALS